MADDRELLIKILLQDQTKQGFDSVNKQVKSTRTSFLNLKNVILGIAGGIVVKQTLELANTYQQLNNKLKLVTDGSEELSLAQEKLFKVAQSTRQPFTDTVDLFQKLALNSKNLGLNQGELVKVTENVNKLVTIAGVGSAQASAGILQLSQAFASGRLQGDEFRSISENIPPILDVLAKNLGVTRGELKKMASEGKLTGDVLASALLGQTADINSQFEKTAPTISQAVTLIGNSLVEFIGNVEKQTGVLTGVANAIIFLNNAFMGLTDLLKGTNEQEKVFRDLLLEISDLAPEEQIIAVDKALRDYKDVVDLLSQYEANEVFQSPDDLLVNGVKITEDAKNYATVLEAINKLLDRRVKLEEVIAEEKTKAPNLSKEIEAYEKLIKANKSKLEAISKENEEYGLTEIQLSAKKHKEERLLIEQQIKAINDLKKAQIDSQVLTQQEADSKYLTDLQTLEKLKTDIIVKSGMERARLLKEENERNLQLQKEYYDKNLSEIKNRNFQFENLDKMSEENKVKLAKQGGRDLLEELAKRNKVAFAINKALAIRDAIISTSQGMASALKWGWPLGPIFAGIIGGLGAVQIANIASQQYQGRALGGRVEAGSTYMVGEQGAEMFVPNQSGTIIANKDLGRATNVNITINANDTQGFDDLLVKRRSVIVNVINDALNSQGKEALV